MGWFFVDRLFSYRFRRSWPNFVNSLYNLIKTIIQLEIIIGVLLHVTSLEDRLHNHRRKLQKLLNTWNGLLEMQETIFSHEYSMFLHHNPFEYTSSCIIIHARTISNGKSIENSSMLSLGGFRFGDMRSAASYIFIFFTSSNESHSKQSCSTLLSLLRK